MEINFFLRMSMLPGVKLLSDCINMNVFVFKSAGEAKQHDPKQEEGNPGEHIFQIRKAILITVGKANTMLLCWRKCIEGYKEYLISV